MRKQLNKRFAVQKSAIERILKSDDGALLMQYLGDISLTNIGVPCKDALEYAYNEGKRSVVLALMQVAEKDLGQFIYDMVIDEERSF